MTNAALIKSLYEAFAAGDVPTVLGAMSPDIVWVEAENSPYADQNPYVGPDAVLHGVFGRCIADWDGFAAIPGEILDAGDTVVVLGRYHGTCKATGIPQHTQMVHVWRLADGKIVGFQQYCDTLQQARASGLVS